MKPLARNFGEIHGVDVSDEMIRLARERLRGVRTRTFTRLRHGPATVRR